MSHWRSLSLEGGWERRVAVKGRRGKAFAFPLGIGKVERQERHVISF